jgi:ribosomal protein S18 acetylase RimI-like enzyme
MVSIVFYNDGFYGEVVRILRESGMYDEEWEKRGHLKNKIRRDPESILVAVDGKKTVGCVFIAEDGWNGFIWRLCVKKGYRGKGVGSSLMRKAEEIIRGRGLAEASVFVDPENGPLKGWYEKKGYAKASDWTFMYKKLGGRKEGAAQAGAD